MKHLRFLLLAIITCVLTCSCDGLSNKYQKRIYTPDISIRKVSGMNYAYYQGDTIRQHQADALNSNDPGINLASAIYDELKIRTLRSLPNCSFSH